MSRPVSERWPEGACCAHVSVPVSLLRHAAALGLGDGHVRLLVAHETFRRAAGEPIYPSQKTLAELCGCSVSMIERRTRELRDSGLIEVERRPRPGGKRLNHYTRRGLGAALARLEAEASYPAQLRASSSPHPVPPRGGDPAPARASNPAPMHGEVEAGEQKQRSTRRARALASLILGLFNDAACTSFDESSLRQIAARVREHPELGLDDYRHMIAAAFRNPWWTPPFGPGVIFSPEQFEIALDARRRESKGRDHGHMPPAATSENGRGARVPDRYTRRD